MALMNPFMKKELTSILYLHNDINEFFKFVPREMMPKDYGGQLEETKVARGRTANNINIFIIYTNVYLYIT